MKIRVFDSIPEKNYPSTLLVFAYDDPKPFDSAIEWLGPGFKKNLHEHVRSGMISGRFHDFVILHPNEAGIAHVIVLGAGKRKAWGLDRLRSLAAKGARIARRLVVSDLAIPIGRAAKLNAEESAVAAVEGVLLGLYRFKKYKSKKNPRKEGILNDLVLCVGAREEKTKAEHGAQRGRILAEATTFVRDLVNEPANVMTPTAFAESAKEMARAFGLEIEVFDKKKIESLRMGAFLSVARGSEEPPKLVIVRTKRKKGFTLGLVGKGVTFDSGGISIKPSENMHHMTDDMAGAAACLGAMRAIAALDLPVNVMAVMPLSENLPDGKASKPGDIVTTHSGKTIEILNTDAEGRLLLADALSFVCSMKVDAVVDVATLTGAMVVALGHVATGVFATDAKLIEEIKRASLACDEPVWPMPLFEEYGIQTRGALADLKNTAGRNGGACTAAAFLKEFVGEVPWAHLDIAGTARLDQDKTPYALHSYLPKTGATGVGVRLLTHLAERLSKQKMRKDEGKMRER